MTCASSLERSEVPLGLEASRSFRGEKELTPVCRTQATGEVCNIHDAYTDERFDSTADEATGFRTTNVLCGPINDQRGEVVGVLQVDATRATIPLRLPLVF